MSALSDVLLSKIDVIIVMGVSGSGKTTVGNNLANSLKWLYKDGDDFHSDANVVKMASGTPLNDTDRMPWLTAINTYCRTNRGVVIGCSALKRSYRILLRNGVRCRFVFLNVSRNILEKRLKNRKGHYMPPELLNSQLSTLEDPSDEEDVIPIEIMEEHDPSVLNDVVKERLLKSI